MSGAACAGSAYRGGIERLEPWMCVARRRLGERPRGRRRDGEGDVTGAFDERQAPRAAGALPAGIASDRRAVPLISNMNARPAVQVAGQGQEVSSAARQVGAVAATATADGVAEFREMFISLVGPAGLADMEACGRTAGRMEEAASRAGYEAGARMASILADIFAAVDDMAGRPVEDGAMGHTDLACQFMLDVLYETAEAYRDGGDAEPISELEYARDRILRQKIRADRYREQLRAAGGPPGSTLPWIERKDVGRVCRDVIREETEEVRERQRKRGHDPVFPPKPRTPREICPEWGDGMSATEIQEMMSGNIPDGYELVRVGKDGK